MDKSDNWSHYEIEITRKSTGESERPKIISPATAYELFRETALSTDQEGLWVLSLDGQNGLIGIQKVYTGTAMGTSVRIAEIVRTTSSRMHRAWSSFTIIQAAIQCQATQTCNLHQRCAEQHPC